jgi:hypothetical protein
MTNTKNNSILAPIFITFAGISMVTFFLKVQLQKLGVSYQVLLFANSIIALLTAVIVLMHKKASTNSNPHVFSRSVLGGTFIKLMVLGGITVVYLLISKEQRNIGGILGGMLLYIVYTIVEVKLSLKLNKK